MQPATATKTVDVQRDGQLIRHDAPATVPARVSDASSILQVIERAALNPDIDINKMERLMAMYDQVTARTARAAYAAALAAMQPELPVIAERGRIEIGGKSSKAQTYALWEDINEAIKPVLAKHGFGLSFRTGRDTDKIVVTGILSHRDGHSEETTMHLPIDTSGSKNAVQAVGSSTSYGKRYTASALLNLTSRGEDDDGKGAGAQTETLSDEHVQEISDLLTETKSNLVLFLKAIKLESLTQIRADKFEAVKALIRETAKKRAEREAAQKKGQ